MLSRIIPASFVKPSNASPFSFRRIPATVTLCYSCATLSQVSLRETIHPSTYFINTGCFVCFQLTACGDIRLTRVSLLGWILEFWSLWVQVMRSEVFKLCPLPFSHVYIHWILSIKDPCCARFTFPMFSKGFYVNMTPIILFLSPCKDVHCPNKGTTWHRANVHCFCRMLQTEG